MTMSQCITKEQAGDPSKLVPQGAGGGLPPDCKVSDVKTEGNKTSWAMKCEGQMPMSGTGEFTFNGDLYTGLMKIDTDRGGQPITITMNTRGSASATATSNRPLNRRAPFGALRRQRCRPPSGRPARVEAAFERIQQVPHVPPALGPRQRPAHLSFDWIDGRRVAAVGRHRDIVGIAQHDAVLSRPDHRADPLAGSGAAAAGR